MLAIAASATHASTDADLATDHALTLLSPGLANSVHHFVSRVIKTHPDICQGDDQCLGQLNNTMNAILDQSFTNATVTSFRPALKLALENAIDSAPEQSQEESNVKYQQRAFKHAMNAASAVSVSFASHCKKEWESTKKDRDL